MTRIHIDTHAKFINKKIKNIMETNSKMQPLTAIAQATETVEMYFKGAQKIFDNWYEGERDIAVYPEILKVLIEAQQKDFEHSVRIGQVEMPNKMP
jgi:esterase/lipase